jgi:hypothetical protein
MASRPAECIFARWPLAVCGVMRAHQASSPAVSARPSIRAVSIWARATSPIRLPTSAKFIAFTLVMT